MSTTMILSMAPIPGGGGCSTCGANLEESATMLADAQRRIKDLEAQVTLLNQKCTSAVDRIADYEDELALLKSQALLTSSSPRTAPIQTRSLSHTRNQTQTSLPSPASSSPPRPESYQSRLSTFLSTRKSLSSILPSSSSSHPSPSTTPEPDLLSLYTLEVAARQKAEKELEDMREQLDKGGSEMEELSTQLFMQANEMVATERRARAKLEERSTRLEERVRVLEGRDEGKRVRLEKLEGAVVRIERVRGLLGVEG